MSWLAKAVALIAPWEGCEKRRGNLVYPYLDTLAKPPVATRGYGRTYGITMQSAPITVDEAKRELAHGAANYGAQCIALAPALADPKHSGAAAAVTSWAWNCGVGAFRVSRLRRAINEGRWADAAEHIRTPRTAGGVELRGLVRRRDAERAMLLSDSLSS